MTADEGGRSVGVTMGILIDDAAVGRALSRAVLAAVLIFGAVPGARGQDEEVAGFSVRQVDQRVADSLAEFERYRDKGAWEKAFTALGDAAEGHSDGLMPPVDGFLLPLGMRLRQELVSLPPAGREAYRLFNDAKAQQLLLKAEALGMGDAGALRELVDRYFITSVGDQAADRLGDALFESGRFAAAAAMWQSIVRDYPDPSVPQVRLETKRAVALARAGDWAQFDEALTTLREKFAGQSAHIGGRDVVAERFVAGLKDQYGAGRQATTAAAGSARGGDAAVAAMALPESDTPGWQMKFASDDFESQLEQQLSQFGWGGMTSNFVSVVPPVAIDAHRVYVNWSGACFAVDRRTGKLLWRTGKFADMAQQLPQLLMRGQTASRGAIIAAGDKVLVVATDVDLIMQQNRRVDQLKCLHADTGKEIWAMTAAPTPEWSILGTPLLSGDIVYATAMHFDAADTKMTLLAISMSDGKVLWSLPLGTPVTTTNFRGMAVWPEPQLVQDGGTLYVMTNNGAVLAVDTTARELVWAFVAKIPAPPANQIFFSNTPGPPTENPGHMMLCGSTLYFKEHERDLAFGINLAGESGVPSLAWRRRVDDETMLAGVEAGEVYLVGIDAEGIDLASKDMVWATRISAVADGLRPVVAGNHLYAFTPRGVYDVDLAGGDVGRIFRGYDRQGVGGAIWPVDGQLITVSNVAVTSYPITRAGAATRGGG